MNRQETLLVGTGGLQRRVLRALRVAQVLGGIGQAVAGSAGALLANHITGSTASAGIPQAAITLGAAAAAVGASWVARRATRRRSLAAALLTGAVGAAVAAVSAAISSMALLAAGSVLLGAGNAAVMLARYAATDLAEAGARSRAVGAVLLATTVGAVAGPNLLRPATALSTVIGVPRFCGPYLVGGVTYGLAAAALAGLLRPDPLEVVRSVLPPPPRRDRSPFRSVLRRRAVWSAILALALANAVMVGVMTMAPLQMVAMGHGLGVVGMVVSAHIAAMFLPSAASGYLADRIGAPAAVTIGGAILAAAALLAAIGASVYPAVVIAMVLLGAGWNVTVVAASAMLTSDVEPAARPRLEATGEVAMGVAAAAGSLGAGALVAAGGYAAPAWIGLTVAVALASIPACTVARGEGAPLRRRDVLPHGVPTKAEGHEECQVELTTCRSAC